MTLLHCRRCHFSLHHSQHCHHSFACNFMIDWVNWQWQRFAEMHFYLPPLLLYCDTKITYLLPSSKILPNASFWKCAGKLTPYHLRRVVTVMIWTFQDPHRPIQLLPWDGGPLRPQKADVNPDLRFSSQSTGVHIQQDGEISGDENCTAPDYRLICDQCMCPVNCDQCAQWISWSQIFNNFLNPCDGCLDRTKSM